MDFSHTDWGIVASTLVAPLIAVQITRLLDRLNQRRESRVQVFRTLMTTRAVNLAPNHIEALNLIDVVFVRRRGDRVVREAWRRYFAHLNNKVYPRDLWNPKRIELLVELLYAMAQNLGYGFDKTLIETQAYSPSSVGSLEEEQQRMRTGLIGVLGGTHPLPVRIVTAAEAASVAPTGPASIEPKQPT
jgi:hypothetical protein